MKQKNDKHTVKWIFQVAGSGNKWVLALLAVRLLQGTVGVLYALLLGQVIDGAVSGVKSVFFTQLAYFGGLLLAALCLQMLNRVFTEKATAVLTENFRGRLFGTLLERDYRSVTQVHTGQWMSRLTSDTNVVVNGWISILPGLCNTLVRLGSAVTALMLMLPKLVYLLLPAGLAMGLVSLAFRKKLKGFHGRIQKADSAVHSFMQERLGSLLIVRAFTREERTQQTADELLKKVSRTKMRRVHFVNLCNTLLHGALYAAQLVGVGMCGLMILQGKMSYGDMSAVLHLVGQMETPLANVSGFLPQYYAMLASAERLMEPESYLPDRTEAAKTVEEAREYYETKLATVCLQQVNFSYEEGDRQTVLQDVNISIKKGEFVAFTGPSGCGKSTAMKLMLGLYTPDSGYCCLTDSQGQEEPLDATWRALFAYVPQGNLLVSGTVRQTLTFGDEALAKQEKEIWRALKVACAEDFVRALPEGLETPLGERGSGLSEGQMQRLAIARAILSRRPILLLDEATSALDGETEARLLENLRRETGCTVLLISHREAALAVCHRQIQFGQKEC